MKIGYDPIPLGGYFGNSTYTTELLRALGKKFASDRFLIPTTFFNRNALKNIFGSIPSIKSLPILPGPMMFGKPLKKRMLALSRFIERKKAYGLYDCYHCTNPLLFNDCCERSIVTIHDLIPLLNEPTWLDSRETVYYRTAVPAILKKCSHIITVSRATKSSIGSFFPWCEEKKIHVVHLAAGPQFVQRNVDRNILRKYGFTDVTKPFFLSVGVFSGRKNVPFFLDAFAALPEHIRQDAMVILTGNRKRGKPYQPILDSVDRNGINGSVRVVVNVPTEELVDLYNLAQALVFPSHYEGFGLPILEAMACGCPVITASNTSLPEVAGDAAHYIDPKDRNSCTNALASLLTNESYRRQLIETGFNRVKQFSWETAADQTHSVYEEAVLRQ